MIGVALVAFITVFAASAKASVSSSVDKAITSDWIVTTQFGMGGMSPTVTKQIDALPETGSVTPVRFFDTQGRRRDRNGIGRRPGAHRAEHPLRHAIRRRHDVGLHDVTVQTDAAKTTHVEGRQHRHDVLPGDGQPAAARGGNVRGTKDPFGNYAMSIRRSTRTSRRTSTTSCLCRTQRATRGDARHAIENVLSLPDCEADDEDRVQGFVANQINQILNLIYVLLAMALVIAFFGIANTLALSVFERTREFGLLRAVGMGRRQVRSTVRWESVLIALLGTTLGIAIGLGFGSAVMVKAAASQGLNKLAIPTGELAVIVGLAARSARGRTARSSGSEARRAPGDQRVTARGLVPTRHRRRRFPREVPPLVCVSERLGGPRRGPPPRSSHQRRRRS